MGHFSSPGEEKGRGKRPQLTKEQQLQIQRQMKEKLKTFLLNVDLVPKELVFIGRAMRILQANNQALGM